MICLARRTRCGALFGLLLACGWATSAHAVPIEYTFAGTGSGNLGEVAFNAAHFRFDVKADTSDVTHPPGTSLYVVIGTGTLTVDGGPVATLTNPTSVVDNQGSSSTTGVVVLGDSTQDLAIAVVRNPAVFHTYDLSSPLGPVDGMEVGVVDAGIHYPTTAGPLSFTGITAVSFSASQVPEPAPCVLYLALSGSALLRRQRRDRA